MRLLAYELNRDRHVGVLTADGIAPSPYSDMLDVIDDGPAAIAALRNCQDAFDRIRESDVRVLAPVRPRKILAVGLNYESHFLENPNAVLPSEPFFFSKLPTAVIGPNEAIVLPHPGLDVDYEVELAAVIGKRGSSISAEDALDFVFGYTLMNDVSARAVQFRDQQITLGKNIDTFAPLGPCIVLAEAIEDPQDLGIQSFVNGEPRQDASTGEQLCSVAAAIAWLTTFMTLEPGDVIATGTPAGCGTFMQPPQWLEPGDIVKIACEAIGEMSNGVVAGPDYKTSWDDKRNEHALAERMVSQVVDAGMTERKG